MPRLLPVIRTTEGPAVKPWQRWLLQLFPQRWALSTTDSRRILTKNSSYHYRLCVPSTVLCFKCKLSCNHWRWGSFLIFWKPRLGKEESVVKNTAGVWKTRVRACLWLGMPVSLNPGFSLHEQHCPFRKTPALHAKFLSILLFKGTQPNLFQYQFSISFTSAPIVSFTN